MDSSVHTACRGCQHTEGAAGGGEDGGRQMTCLLSTRLLRFVPKSPALTLMRVPH